MLDKTALGAIHDQALAAGVDAWNHWENWMLGDPVEPRLRVAIEAAVAVWIDSIGNYLVEVTNSPRFEGGQKYGDLDGEM